MLFFMVSTYFLSLANFLYGYKEAIRISNEHEHVNGWGLILSLPFALTFAYFANFFYHQL